MPSNPPAACAQGRGGGACRVCAGSWRCGQPIRQQQLLRQLHSIGPPGGETELGLLLLLLLLLLRLLLRLLLCAAGLISGCTSLPRRRWLLPSLLLLLRAGLPPCPSHILCCCLCRCGCLCCCSSLQRRGNHGFARQPLHRRQLLAVPIGQGWRQRGLCGWSQQAGRGQLRRLHPGCDLRRRRRLLRLPGVHGGRGRQLLLRRAPLREGPPGQPPQHKAGAARLCRAGLAGTGGWELPKSSQSLSSQDGFHIPQPGQQTGWRTGGTALPAPRPPGGDGCWIAWLCRLGSTSCSLSEVEATARPAEAIWCSAGAGVKTNMAEGHIQLAVRGKGNRQACGGKREQERRAVHRSAGSGAKHLRQASAHWHA